MGHGGTIDLDWSALTPELGERVVQLLNNALSTATRPSFIGPISVSAFEFGDLPPNVELVDIRDIYPDFLEDDEEQASEGSGVQIEREPLPPHPEGFEWIMEQDRMHPGIMGRGASHSYSYHEPSVSQHHADHATSDFGARLSQGRSSWDPRRGTYTPGLGASITSLHDPRYPLGTPHLFSGAMNTSNRSTPPPPFEDSPYPHARVPSFPSHDSSDPSSSSPNLNAQDSSHPDLQLHFRISFESNLRIALSTSLQINYPSPLIMSLPMKLAVTGLIFEGEVVVAYEGSRRRVHMCILDESIQGGPVPAWNRHEHDEGESEEEKKENREDQETSLGLGEKAVASSRIIAGSSTKTTIPSRIPAPMTPSKLAVPAGLRLLPSIFIESEIGQEDKHVLRNVARVERFIQDVIRKTLQEELVYPNFQTIVLPGSHEE